MKPRYINAKEDNMTTTPARDTWNRNPAHPGRLNVPPQVESKAAVLSPRAAGVTLQPSTTDSAAGGVLPVVEAKLQECDGLMPDYWIATCPSCRSTKKVPGVDGAVTACTSCGAAFFTRRAA